MLYKVKSNSKFADYLEHYYYEFPIIRYVCEFTILKIFTHHLFQIGYYSCNFAGGNQSHYMGHQTSL